MHLLEPAAITAAFRVLLAFYRYQCRLTSQFYTY